MLLYDRSMLVYAMMQSEGKGDVLRRQDGKCPGNNECGLRNAALDETTNERQVNKMIKKLISLVMVLMLLAVVPAYAESFFPAIPTKAPAQTEYVPSYAACMGVSPVAEDWGFDYWLQAYDNVTQEKFNQFGSYLNQKGYALTDSRYEGTALIATVAKGNISFRVEYDWEALTLEAEYSGGVTPEAASAGTGSTGFIWSGITADTNTATATEVPKASYKPDWYSIAAGFMHTVALKDNGTVVAVGENNYGQCNVSGWKDIVSVSAGTYFTVGLKADGTVVATGQEVGANGWRNATAVSAGGYHTLVLTKDGTVLASGSNHDGQCDTEEWCDIVAISAGGAHSVGLRADGTVVAVGKNKFGQCNVGDWTEIVAIAAGRNHTVGLKSDGTVVAVGSNVNINGKSVGQCNVGDLTNIVAIAAGGEHTVCVKADGSVVTLGEKGHKQNNVYGWENIVAVAASANNTVGLKADGTVVAAGDNLSGQSNVGSWKNIRVPEK